MRALALVLLVTFLIFFQALRGGFLALDDELLILDNPTVHGFSPANVAKAFRSYDPELYIPLTLLSYQIEWSLVGGNPWLYHMTNIVIHLLSAAFVFLILRRLFSANVAVVCALLFSLHPLQVEAVAWVSGRKDLLASMFFLASTHQYLRWRESGRRKFLSVILFFLGLLSKVSVFPLPLCLLLLDDLRGDRISRERIAEKWPYFALAAVFVVIAFFGKPVQAGDPLVPMLMVPVAVSRTLLHAVYPVGLAVFYPFVESLTILHSHVLGGALVIFAIAVVCAWSRKRVRFLTFAALWFFILLAPSFLNAPKGGELGVPDLYVTSDRYAYLALLGLIFSAGFVLRRIRWGWILGTIPLAIFAATTFRQIGTWRTSDALFRNVIDVGEPSHVAYTNLAGYAALNGELIYSESLYEQSLAIRRTTRGLFNLAQVKAVLGKKAEAIALFSELLRMHPGDLEARNRFDALNSLP